MKVLESCLYAEDLAAAKEFYVGVLGLEQISFDLERDLFLRCDGSVLIVFKASKTSVGDAGVPTHGATGPGHLAFASGDEELDKWDERLGMVGVDVVQRIEWKNGARSIYFKDPAGNILEFATPRLWGL